MADINIGIKIPMGVDDIDLEKVTKLLKKFAKAGEKVDASPFEIGAAISLLQDHYYDAYGAIPISKQTIAAIQDSRMFEAKEG